jgi:hypothetical protein
MDDQPNEQNGGIVTQDKKEKALELLSIFLELVKKTRFHTAIISEAWGATIMAEKCGVITWSSCERILRYLDQREKEIDHKKS